MPKTAERDHMKELKNRQAVIDQIVGMLMAHDIDHTCYQEDIYLYIDDKGVGTVETFTNVGGNSWLDNDHITVYCMKEDHSDWTDFAPNMSDIAEVLGWSLNSLKERTAAWMCESGWQYDAKDVNYQDVRQFIDQHPVLLNQIKDAEEQYIKHNLCSEYQDKAEMLLDEALKETEDYIV